MKITILHTNDIHGRLEGIARIGALVASIRSQAGDSPVLYFDLGDSEDYANRLSSLTKGAAVHRLLETAGCNAVVLGNAILSRYGPGAIEDEADSVVYPHLAANLLSPGGSQPSGTQATAILDAGDIRLGLIGLTSEFGEYTRYYGIEILPWLTLLPGLIAALHAAGADAVIVLSHMGLELDRQLAGAFQGQISLILGGHSHSLLPAGEWVGNVLVAQAGENAEHLGRVELEWDGVDLKPVSAAVIPVNQEIQPSADVLRMQEKIEFEIQYFLDEILCELVEALDYATGRECALGNLMADALRQRSQADLAVLIPGPDFTEGLPAGELRRELLWSTCPSTGNPGLVQMQGWQLAELMRRGSDLEFAADKHPALRGHARGLVHLSGGFLRDGNLFIGGQPLEAQRVYRVAGTDFEFEPVWGYVEQEWGLRPGYEMEVILREALEEYLRLFEHISVEVGRLG